MSESALGNRTHGAGIGTGAAINAGTGIDHHMLVTHGDRTHRAAALTSAAADAIAADNIGHDKTPPK